MDSKHHYQNIKNLYNSVILQNLKNVNISISKITLDKKSWNNKVELINKADKKSDK